jgi:hypothetical protein
MRVGIPEFETAAFEGFEKEWFCFSVITLLFVQHGEFVHGLQRVWMIGAEHMVLAFNDLTQQFLRVVVSVLLPVEYAKMAFRSE